MSLSYEIELTDSVIGLAVTISSLLDLGVCVVISPGLGAGT